MPKTDNPLARMERHVAIRTWVLGIMLGLVAIVITLSALGQLGIHVG